MKGSLKKYEKYLSIHHYVTVLKRQPVHMQHVYAIIFAGSVTLFLAICILYFDYGLWHEKYRRDEVLTQQEGNDTSITVVSPGDMIGGFLKEAGQKLKSINTDGTTLLQGKDVYTKDDEKQEVDQ